MPLSDGTGCLSTEIFCRHVSFGINRWTTPIRIELGSELNDLLRPGVKAALLTDKEEELWLEVETQGLAGWRALLAGGSGMDAFLTRNCPDYRAWRENRNK